jgi:hypothetical protein
VLVIEFFVNLPSRDFGASARPSTPKVLQAREHAPTPSSTLFTFGFVVESIKELEGVNQI